MNNIFSLPVKSLTQLTPDRSVDFFRRMLWAEAARVGVARFLIDVPDCINVGDGGIDAIISNASPSSDDVIPAGTSGYQIKASDLSPADCAKELHQENDLAAPLKKGVVRILDEGGTYVLGLFADVTGEKRHLREESLRLDLQRLGYVAPRIRVYTANQLAGFVERFPALVCWIKFDGTHGLSYSAWASRRDVKVPREFVADEKRRLWIEQFRNKVRATSDSTLVYRVTGLPGIGKSRLVFEALSQNDLSNRVLYLEGDRFRASPLHDLLQNDESLAVILVIDECPTRQHDQIVRGLAGRGPRIVLVTLSDEGEDVAEPAHHFRLSPLSNGDVEKTVKLEFPTLPSSVAYRIATFADGYPRIAILIAESYALSSDEETGFLQLRDASLLDRLLAGRLEVGSDRYYLTKRVLEVVALFTRLGFEGPAKVESEWLAQFAGIDFVAFSEIIHEQQQRGIIQGRYFIYVSPFMLRIHLLTQWWSSKGLDSVAFVQLVAGFPEKNRSDLLTRFTTHLAYIGQIDKGREFARQLLSETGLFSDADFINTELGSLIYFRLTEVDPRASLECLQRAIGGWNKDTLLNFEDGRRNVVYALERIVVWRELFAGGARLLLSLACAENETWANNATGLFCALFGPIAPSQAPFDERFPILEESLASPFPERRSLALQAVDQALTTNGSLHIVGAEHQGLRKDVKFWMPKTYGELGSNYQRIWLLLRGELSTSKKEDAQAIARVLLRHSRGLIGSSLSVLIIETLSDISTRGILENKEILSDVIEVLHFDRKDLQPSVVKLLEDLQASLTGEGYAAMMKRYVGMSVVEDDFSEDGKQTDIRRRTIKELAQQSWDDHSLLSGELCWLLTTHAENGSLFGYELGRLDHDFTLLPQVIVAQRKTVTDASLLFLGGYMRALFEQDQMRWEKCMDQLATQHISENWIPEITFRSGMTERAALRILGLAERNIVGIDDLRIYGYGLASADIPEGVFKRWLDFLLGNPDPSAISLALNICHTHYARKEAQHKLSPRDGLRLLTHTGVLSRRSQTHSSGMDEYYWTDIGKMFVRTNPECALQLAEFVLEHMGRENSLFDRFHSNTHEVLCQITTTHPREVWSIVLKYLGPPLDGRSYRICRWLHGESFTGRDSRGTLSLIPLEEIWKWVDEDVEHRAWYLAHFVPKDLIGVKGESSLVRAVLIRYGDRDDVRRNLAANFSTESHWGPESEHLQRKKQTLVDHKKEETNQNVIRWIDAYIADLDDRTRGARIREEHDPF